MPIKNINKQQNTNQQQNLNKQQNVNQNLNLNKDIINDNIKKKIFEKEHSNNAIMERNIFTNMNNSNISRVIDYPSNSNNELTIPKTNIDNINFSPYNFGEEVDKIKKTLNKERVEFENEEKNRRRLFEQEDNNKKKFLEKQIKKFESEYNPWEILGLKNNDYNINNIKKAYKKNALKYHPDRAGVQYQDKFQLITQAYIYLLSKSEESDQIKKKMSVNVENMDYEDDITEKVENIYIDKTKFDLNKFNEIFEDYKLPSSFDKGYSDLMKEDIKNIENNNDEQIFGKKFNNEIFNAHFNSTKNKKQGSDIIEYREPDALDSSSGNLNQTFLGLDNIEDFGSMNNNNLSYTDYKRAHIDENLLIDVNKVKYKEYNSIDQLESERSRLSYDASPEDKKRYETLERKRQADDELRIRQQQNYDNMANNQYNKLNRKLIIHK